MPYFGQITSLENFDVKLELARNVTKLRIVTLDNFDLMATILTEVEFA